MSSDINLKDAERKVFRLAFQDGLLELRLACVVLIFALGPFLSSYLGDFWGSAVFVPFWAVAFGLLWLVQRQVVRPRLGVVEFGIWRKTRLLRFSWLMLVAGLVSFALAILSMVRFDSVPGWVHTARFSLALVIGFGLSAYALDFAALYLYGVLIALAFIVGEALYAWWGLAHHGYPLTFGLTTGFLFVVGLVKLVRLVRTYPLPEEGAPLERPANG